VVGAEDAFAGAEDVLVLVCCFLVVAEVVEREAEVAAAGQGAGVVGTKDAFVGAEDVLVVVCCFSVPAEVVEREAEVVATVQGAGVIGTKDLFVGAEDLSDWSRDMTSWHRDWTISHPHPADRAAWWGLVPQPLLVLGQQPGFRPVAALTTMAGLERAEDDVF
jgi:hypothetical protein